MKRRLGISLMITLGLLVMLAVNGGFHLMNLPSDVAVDLGVALILSTFCVTPSCVKVIWTKMINPTTKKSEETKNA